MRRTVFLVLAVAAIVVAWFVRPRDGQPTKSDPPAASANSPHSPGPTTPRLGTPGPLTQGSGGPGSGNAGGPAEPAVGSMEVDYPIAAPLNAPGSTLPQDLQILDQLFNAWRTNFPTEGNPVGENAEITAALMGDNRLGLVLIPKGHRAVNENGELCDRWGTPFRFHQLSATQMEIRSAGPDKKFGTQDDGLWTPE